MSDELSKVNGNNPFDAIDTIETANNGMEMPVIGLSDRPLQLQDGTPVVIKLAGIDSNRYRKASRAAQDRRLQSMNNRRLKLTAITLEEEALDTLVACTLGWTGIMLDGQLVECTPENIKKVYLRYPAIKEQVDTFIGDRSNFLKS